MRLNRTGLRCGALPVVSTGTAFARLTRLFERGRLTRRHFLRASALTLPGTYAAGALRSDGRVEIVEQQCTVEFRVDGRTRWAIDPQRFGGTPTLSVRRRGDIVTVELRRAVFPGTAIPADFTCEVWQPGRHWLVRLAMTWGRFWSTGNFVPWLEVNLARGRQLSFKRALA